MTAAPDAGWEERGGLVRVMPADICSVLTHLHTLSLQHRTWSSGHVAEVLQLLTLQPGAQGLWLNSSWPEVSKLMLPEHLPRVILPVPPWLDPWVPSCHQH